MTRSLCLTLCVLFVKVAKFLIHTVRGLILISTRRLWRLSRKLDTKNLLPFSVKPFLLVCHRKLYFCLKLLTNFTTNVCRIEESRYYRCGWNRIRKNGRLLDPLTRLDSVASQERPIGRRRFGTLRHHFGSYSWVGSADRRRVHQIRSAFGHPNCCRHRWSFQGGARLQTANGLRGILFYSACHLYIELTFVFLADRYCHSRSSDWRFGEQILGAVTVHVHRAGRSRSHDWHGFRTRRAKDSGTYASHESKAGQRRRRGRAKTDGQFQF